jgi:hypothetical protein
MGTWEGTAVLGQRGEEGSHCAQLGSTGADGGKEDKCKRSAAQQRMATEHPPGCRLQGAVQCEGKGGSPGNHEDIVSPGCVMGWDD